MSDTHAPVGGEVTVRGELPGSTPAVTASEAAAALSQRRWEKHRQAAAPEPAPTEPVEEPQQELAETPDDAQPEADPVEATETPEPDASPLIEPPRSWTKAEKERWNSLPRETQEYIAQRETEREREIRRTQNEAAEKLKGLSTREQAAEQARQQYEAALPALLQTMHEQQLGEFSDIRTMADVEKLAREDWPRYALWDAQQKKIAAVAQEVNAAKTRQEKDHQDKWSEYASKQDNLLIERIPELADKAKQQKIADGAAAVLRDVGFTDKELADNWTGKETISLRDARLSQIIIEASRYREAKAAKPAPKPLPNVQRPGSAEPRNAAAVQTVQALSKKLEQSGRIDDAAAVIAARRASHARRA